MKDDSAKPYKDHCLFDPLDVCYAPDGYCTLWTLNGDKFKNNTDCPFIGSNARYSATTDNVTYVNFSNDVINHPSYYCGKIETVDYIRDKLTKEGFIGYCVGNVTKYLSRAGKKGDALEDFEKAYVYLGWAIDRMKEGE